jgi:hypothetical protein
MQTLDQNALNKAAIWRPLALLVSTGLDHTQKQLDGDWRKPDKQNTATLAGVSTFTCVFSVILYWTFYVLLLRNAWHTFKEAYVIDVFIVRYIKTGFIVIIILLLRFEKLF